jgi:cell wall-associated NlpC family hydrolase
VIPDPALTTQRPQTDLSGFVRWILSGTLGKSSQNNEELQHACQERAAPAHALMA